MTVDAAQNVQKAVRVVFLDWCICVTPAHIAVNSLNITRLTTDTLYQSKMRPRYFPRALFFSKIITN